MKAILREIKTIAEYEGLSIQEAKLTYAARQKLPKGAFCGPDKSYPAHDAKRVRAGLQRLSQFGKRMPKPVMLRILACLRRRAKKFGVEHDPRKFGGKKKVQETFVRAEDDFTALMENLDYLINKG